MKKEIEVPEIGESVSSGILASWLKEDGENVDEGEEIFELETDKATLGVPSPASGVLSRGAAEGDEVAVGQVVGQIDTDGAAEANAPAPGGEAGRAQEGDTAAAPDSGADEGAGAPAGGRTTPAADAFSPAVRRVVDEHGLDPSKITGTGPRGRVTKADAEKAAKTKGSGGTGTAARPPALGEPSMQENERQRRVPLSNLRRRIAENLVYSRQSSAHVTTFNEVDMSAVQQLRQAHRERFEARHGVRLGMMAFFAKAVTAALERFPILNAALDDEAILYHDYYDIGIAVSSSRGLVVPVLRDTDRLSMAAIEQQISDFADRAETGQLSIDELADGTFTITNGGVFGSLLSTPIINPPQCGILGMHRIQERPVAVNGEVAIRPMMYLALSYDHRLVDGRDAVQFLVTVKAALEEPARLLLDV